MRFAIYARKSVFSDKSDSVVNQIKMCRDYIQVKFPNEMNDILEYADEGLSGATTNRPDLKRMLNDAQSNLIDALVVYQLDRLSRDVRDFSNIYASLEDRHIKFVSVKENIDTNTPIGRAMTMITMVFAQMERESIAERVTDNMLGLAKKGFWTGGNPPFGYVRKQVTVNGKKHVTIVQDPEGVKYDTWIYDTFLANNYSLQGMETAFRKQGIKTRNGKFFSTTQLHKILTMPYCVQATPEVYDYFERKGCRMDPDSPREKWDGSVGVMVYGRTSEKTKRHRAVKPEEWTVCLGLQKPFMPADKWLAVQARFAQNKFEKKQKYDIPLLKGTLRCAKCGCLMQVARKHWNGNLYSSYYCLTRSRKGKDVCDMQMLGCWRLDNKVMEVFRGIEADPASIERYVKRHEEKPKDEKPKRNLPKEIASLENQIGRLAAAIATNDGSAAVPYLVKQMEELDMNLQALRREQAMERDEARKRSQREQSAKDKAAEITKLIHGLDNFTAAERNAIVKKVVKACTWDGETLYLKL